MVLKSSYIIIRYPTTTRTFKNVDSQAPPQMSLSNRTGEGPDYCVFIFNFLGGSFRFGNCHPPVDSPVPQYSPSQSARWQSQEGQEATTLGSHLANLKNMQNAGPTPEIQVSKNPNRIIVRLLFHKEHIKSYFPLTININDM